MNLKSSICKAIQSKLQKLQYNKLAWFSKGQKKPNQQETKQRTNLTPNLLQMSNIHQEGEKKHA